jgi:hypothetical protein
LKRKEGNREDDDGAVGLAILMCGNGCVEMLLDEAARTNCRYDYLGGSGCLQCLNPEGTVDTLWGHFIDMSDRPLGISVYG